MFSLWGQLRLKRILRMAQLPAAHRALQSRAKSVNIMTRDANMFKEGPRGHHHLSSDVRPIYTLVRVHQRVQTTVHHTLPHLWSAKRRPSNDYNKCRPTVRSTEHRLSVRVCTIYERKKYQNDSVAFDSLPISTGRRCCPSTIVCLHVAHQEMRPRPH